MQIARALVAQVALAANGRCETDVVTFITKPMWRAFMKELGHSPNTKPTEWTTIKDTRRVYGSKTIVVDGTKQMASFSVLIANCPTLTKSKRH